MKTFYGDDGNYADIPLSKILDRMTDDWIDDEVTGENISELRDTCRKLLERAHNSESAQCKCSKVAVVSLCQSCYDKEASYYYNCK